MPSAQLLIDRDDSLSDLNLPPESARFVRSECGKFDYVYPARELKSKTTIKPGKGLEAVSAAEHQLMLISFEHDDWARQARVQLRNSLSTYIESEGHDVAALVRTIHEIKGDAANFSFVTAGEFAASLALLLERAEQPARYKKVVETVAYAIIATLSERGKKESAEILELQNAIGVMIHRQLLLLAKRT